MSKPSVLAIDDEMALLDVYRLTLEAEGYDVSTAPDCARATHLLRSRRFDAVISDIHLPDGNGVDLLRAVRENDLDLPVIFVTGAPTMQTAVAAIELGALRYLVKPVRAAELLPVVQKAIRLRRLAELEREVRSELGIGMALAGDRTGLEAAFARALDGLFMAYQPIVQARGGAVFGYEALLRTREPAIPDPPAFLRAAERLDQLSRLGRRIRATVSGAPPSSDATLFVNLHPRDLADDDLLDLEQPLSGIASRVILEVTEREALDPIPELRERVQSLRRLGFRLAVDDLGAGYAGLASFVGLEPEVVKIDMSLVRGIHREPVKRRLVTSIVELCRDLGTLVVAEGIETPDEREVLADIGCDLLQGYALGRPEPHPRETPTGPAPEKGRETILVVEDSASLREMIGEILAGASYDVIEASDPGEALLRAGDAGASFDLVLTDVELPELRGPELVARLRRTGSRARVLYMSGYNAVRGESLSEPGADFIQKPFPAGALLQKIRSLLDAPGP